MNRFLITLVCTFFINFLFSNTLEFTNAQINANDSGQIQLLLDNPNDQIAGLQFQIINYPNQGSFTEVSATERLSGFMIESNQQEDGSLIVLAFSLTGDVLDVGSGAILDLTFQSSSIYSSDITVSIGTEYLNENSWLVKPSLFIFFSSEDI